MPEIKSRRDKLNDGEIKYRKLNAGTKI